MSVYSSIDNAFLPNLPGFRAKDPLTGQKKQHFTLVNGQVFLRDDCLPTFGGGDSADDASAMTFGSQSITKIKKNTMSESLTLTFQAYFEERPDNSHAKSSQVRKCNIYFYVNDGTIKVVEKPQLNSGVSQGTLVSRALIQKSDGSTITAEDIRMGEELVIYGRHYTIVDCDHATRNYLRDRNLNIDDQGSVSVPRDSYQEYRSTLEPGADDSWGKFHSKKNDHKSFIEAKLGHSVNNKGREGFIRYGNKTLKFRCVWDNTSNLYGDVMEFSLMYYLSDDTFEIMSMGGNSKDAQKVKLLKRSKLPKNFNSLMILGERPQAMAYFHWSDLYIGLELEVYGRRLQVSDADRSTRDFYDAFDLPLSGAIYQPVPEVVVHEREIPPPTGFGSEEDSLRSVSGSLMPGPVPAKKLGENKMMSFFASLLSGGIDDVDRKFVISFYLQDNTLKVIEPPVRNSGFSGGVFLSRRALKNEQGETLTEKDLYIGCKLRILKHQFLLLDGNEGTLKWMEDKGLPRSSFYVILDKIRFKILADARAGILTERFAKQETAEDGRGKATAEALGNVLSLYDLVGDADHQVVEHELRTIVRANGNKAKSFDYRKFIEQVVNPTDEFK